MHQPVYLYACTCVLVIGLCICMLWHSSFATPLVLFAFYDSTYIIQYFSANIHTTLLLLLWLLRKTFSSTSTSTLSPPRFLTVCQLILRTFHTTGTPSPATGATQTFSRTPMFWNFLESQTIDKSSHLGFTQTITLTIFIKSPSYLNRS